MGTTTALTTAERVRDLSVNVDTISPDELVNIWLRGRKPATLRTYACGIRDFSRFLGAASPAEAATILISRGRGNANATMRRYRNDLVERELAPATVNAYLAAVRSLIAFAEETGLCDWSLKVRGVKSIAYKDTSGPGLDVVQGMIKKVRERGDQKGARDCAILILLHDLALRRNEVLSLDVQHVDLDSGKLHILAKGFSERQPVTLTDTAKRALTDWIAVRGDEAGALFTNLHRDPAVCGSRLCGSGLYRAVRRAGKDVGVSVRPHGLRHCGVTVALDKTGGDVRKVARYSRHVSLSVLQKYDDNREDFGGKVAQLVAAAREAV